MGRRVTIPRATVNHRPCQWHPSRVIRRIIHRRDRTTTTISEEPIASVDRLPRLAIILMEARNDPHRQVNRI